MTDWTHLRKQSDEDVGEWDIPRVAAWTDGGGVEIDAPGCGTAQLTNAEAQALLVWLEKRYGNAPQRGLALEAYLKRSRLPEECPEEGCNAERFRTEGGATCAAGHDSPREVSP